MVRLEVLTGFSSILGIATGYLIIVMGTLYAFHRRDQYPGRDLGFGRHFVQHDRDRKSALKRIAWMMCGALTGFLFVFLINSAYNPRSTSSLHAFVLHYPLLLPITIVAVAIITFLILEYREWRRQA